ncbi:MAG: tellurite resistance TerB family protein [Myxococcales bacterium]|nr:tellurite resistance TerB family protein [Myxococcales bacterium]MCB9628557.1 tellurite resistance TerB family protein [Sandaracinaceae bacterium]
MEIDKSQAVAIAAFSRFDDDVHDPVLRAVSAAYCLVACADGELEASEIAEYVRVAQADARFERLDNAKLEHALRSFAEALQTDVVAGRARALEMVRLAAQDGEDSATCTLLLDVAKLAMQANHKVSKGEVAALRSLCAALGVNPREHLPED